jgi:hypothetical protein
MQHEVQCDVVFYNQTKGGVDTCDQMVKSVTVKRKINRWPLIIFYRIVDFAFLTLLSYGVQYFLSPTISRRKYQMQLSMELSKPHISRRSLIPELRKSITQAMQACGVEIPVHQISLSRT